MSPKLPIYRHWTETDSRGRICVIEIRIVQIDNTSFYPPDGIKSVFLVKRERTPGSENFETIILIDNHEPYGFHEHSNLPDQPSVRLTVHASNWQAAWRIFETRLEELFDET
jgi:hypothetical protein